MMSIPKAHVAHSRALLRYVETSVRVWDSLMIEGCKVVHRVALALLKRFETVIQSSSQEVHL